jgi:hypothetical protein
VASSLAQRLGKWLLKKAADEALKELQKRKEKQQ